MKKIIEIMFGLRQFLKREEIKARLINHKYADAILDDSICFAHNTTESSYIFFSKTDLIFVTDNRGEEKPTVAMKISVGDYRKAQKQLTIGNVTDKSKMFFIEHGSMYKFLCNSDIDVFKLIDSALVKYSL